MSPKLDRIVVATDFSELSNAAVELAVAIAAKVDATLDLIHVAVDVAIALPPPMDVVSVPIDPVAVVADASARLSAEQDRLRARGVKVESSVLVGRSDAEIVAYADETHADLIVIATHGRSGIGHALLGSVAEKVVQHAHCPVLTVPHRHPKPL
jgi:universal stress protein A